MKFLIKISQFLCLLFIVIPAVVFAVETPTMGSLQSDGLEFKRVDVPVPGGVQKRRLPWEMNTTSTQQVGPPAGQPVSSDRAAANAAANDPAYNTGLVPCSICTLKQIITMGVRIYNYLTGFGAILAVAAIVYSGFLYITAQGDTGQMADAKQKITYAIIGLIILAASALIVNTVINWIGGVKKIQNVENVTENTVLKGN